MRIGRNREGGYGVKRVPKITYTLGAPPLELASSEKAFPHIAPQSLLHSVAKCWVADMRLSYTGFRAYAWMRNACGHWFSPFLRDHVIRARALHPRVPSLSLSLSLSQTFSLSLNSIAYIKRQIGFSRPPLSLTQAYTPPPPSHSVFYFDPLIISNVIGQR